MRLPLLAAALLIAATPAFAQQPVRGGVLRVAVAADPPTLDCHAADSYVTLHAVTPHYSTLLKIDPERYPDPKGDLAESWTVTPDGLTYTFKLHPGIKFHDGTPLTSRDVAVTYERLRNPPAGVPGPRKEMFASIRSIETPDPLTIVFKLGEVDPAMLAVFASPWNCVYSAAKLASDPDYPAKNVMGSGPFVFVEQVAGDHWTGKRFDDYFLKGQPYLDGFRNQTISGAALLQAFQGGQIDAEFRSISPPQRDRLKQAVGDKITVHEGDWLLMLMMAFNTEKPPFDDVRVRRALTLAIDRWKSAEALRKITVAGRVGGLLRPGYAYAARDEELEKLPGFGRDIEKSRAEARRLLAEAGVKDLRVKFTNRQLGEPYTALGILILDSWRAIGVQAEQVMLESASFLAQKDSGAFDVIMDFTSEFVDEPTFNLQRYLSRDRSSLNSARYIDREVDALYDRMRREPDVDARRKLVRRLEDRVVGEAYFAPLFFNLRYVAMSSKVQGWKVTPSIYANQDFAAIWIKPD
jgi:peptide/nickel transport system substrate-binding protein